MRADGQHVLGVLAGFGLKLNPKVMPTERGIELLNAKPRVTELLENLGALHLFTVVNGALELQRTLVQIVTVPAAAA